MSQYAVGIIAGVVMRDVPHLSVWAAVSVAEDIVDALIDGDAADFGVTV